MSRQSARRLVYLGVIALGTAALGLSGATVASGTSGQTIIYSRGQNVVPAFEGWEQNPDETYSLWFGYMNRTTTRAPPLSDPRIRALPTIRDRADPACPSRHRRSPLWRSGAIGRCDRRSADAARVCDARQTRPASARTSAHDSARGQGRRLQSP